MKLLSSVIIIFLLATGIHCTPFREMRSENAEIFIKLECRNDKQLLLNVKQILKSAMAADLDVREDYSVVYVQARYLSLSIVKVDEIKQRLADLPGVFDIEVKKDGVPVKTFLYRRDL
jgi:hypothetical protein